MNSENSLNKSSEAIFTELSQAVERLKQQAKLRFDKTKNNSDDEYEQAYIQGFFFGQMASLEDCYNLFTPLLSKACQENGSANLALKQQLRVVVKIIDDLTEKVNNNQPLEQYLDLIKDTISLIKESYKNI